MQLSGKRLDWAWNGAWSMDYVLAGAEDVDDGVLERFWDPVRSFSLSCFPV